MSTELRPNEFASQLVASKDYFERSTRVLSEGDSEFRPKEGMRTAAQQVAHAAQTLDWFINGMAGDKGFDMDFEKQEKMIESVRSLTAARQMLDAAYTKAIAYAKSRSSEDFAKPLPPGPILGGQPLADVFWAMIEHTAHHRGALTVYSRLLGKVPLMPYVE